MTKYLVIRQQQKLVISIYFDQKEYLYIGEQKERKINITCSCTLGIETLVCDIFISWLMRCRVMVVVVCVCLSVATPASSYIPTSRMRHLKYEVMA